MNSSKNGFMLIELLIATAIASMMSIGLLTILNQLNKSAVALEDFADANVKASVVHQQFERDLAGVFTPVAAQLDEKKTSTSQAEPAKKADTNPAPSVAKLSSSDKKKEPKKLTKVFYGTSKGPMFELMSFITSNPVQIYWKEKAGKPKPRIARVIYRLIADKENKNSYNLMRQEGTNLEFDSYKADGSQGAKSFEVISGIKSMTVEYQAEQKNKDDGKKTSQEKEKKKPEYKTSKEWRVEQKESKKDAKKEEKKISLIPDRVIIKFDLWDNQFERDTSYEFKFALIEQGQNSEPEIPTGQKGIQQAMNIVEDLAKKIAEKFPQIMQQNPTDAPPSLAFGDELINMGANIVEIQEGA